MTYNDLVNNYRDTPKEIPTAPLVRRSPTWFKVYEHRGTIYIASGEAHPNASSICPDRRLNPGEFSEMLELYLMRKQGKPVSRLAKKSINSVYWFGIFNDLGI